MRTSSPIAAAVLVCLPAAAAASQTKDGASNMAVRVGVSPSCSVHVTATQGSGAPEVTLGCGPRATPPLVTTEPFVAREEVAAAAAGSDEKTEASSDEKASGTSTLAPAFAVAVINF